MIVRLKRRRVRRKITVDFSPQWKKARRQQSKIENHKERELPRIQDLFDSHDEDK